MTDLSTNTKSAIGISFEINLVLFLFRNEKHRFRKLFHRHHQFIVAIGPVIKLYRIDMQLLETASFYWTYLINHSIRLKDLIPS